MTGALRTITLLAGLLGLVAVAQAHPATSTLTQHRLEDRAPAAGADEDGPERGAKPSRKAARVMAVIDALDVERHWPAGVHVNWRTGVPDGGREPTEGRHTHCSAFVAAAAERLGVYILRPPEHKQTLLANAQYDWLADETARQGWTPLEDGADAQAHANRGWLVLAAYRNHHDDKPGHIVIVRPGEKSAQAIQAEGPDVTQAGTVNYQSVAMKIGFSGHPHAFADGEIRFYAHKILKSDLP